MFEGLIDRFEKLKRKIFGYGRITQQELTEFAHDLRLTLLEADVNYLVVKDFITRVETRAQSLELRRSLNPGNLLLKVVHEELTSLLGGKPSVLVIPPGDLKVISLVGLQGTGKTTTAVKLANWFKNRKPLLVAADTKRPAAREQLAGLASKANLPVFTSVSLRDSSKGSRRDKTAEPDPVKICQQAKKQAQEDRNGLLVIDTAGRLHIDDDLVRELVAIDKAIGTDWKIIVVDGMTGQDAVTQARQFNSSVGLSGAVITKLDGDAKGGAALSIVAKTSVPIFFIGTGEKITGLEEFHPDRIASRILGMGDVQTLAEKISTLKLEPGVDQVKRMKKGDLSLEDFRQQMQQMKKLGPLSNLVAMIPGVKADDFDEKELVKVEAIINSMTRQERNRPELVDGSRKRRIAEGSGTMVQDVNQLLKQFSMARDMLKQMSRGKMPSLGKFKIQEPKK